MLRIDLKVGESIKVGDTLITLDDKSGKVARLAIEAPKTVPINRVQAGPTAAHFAKSGIGPMKG